MRMGHTAVWRGKRVMVMVRDGDNFNNQKSNLAQISYRLFRAGSAPKSDQNHTSKYKGVGFMKREQKWRAECDGKRLGTFDNEEDAARAYDVEAYNRFGEWAYQNFPASKEGAIHAERLK